MSLPDLATPDDLSDYRSGDAATVVRQAQGAVRRYCGWHIAPLVTETLTLDGPGGRHLWLPSLNVSDIDEITDDGDTVDADDYHWSSTGYVARKSCAWSCDPRAIVVTLDHGFDDIPDELVGVVSALASRRLASPAGIRREQAGQVSFEYGGSEFFADERRILDLYKLPPRP